MDHLRGPCRPAAGGGALEIVAKHPIVPLHVNPINDVDLGLAIGGIENDHKPRELAAEGAERLTVKGGQEAVGHRPPDTP